MADIGRPLGLLPTWDKGRGGGGLVVATGDGSLVAWLALALSFGHIAWQIFWRPRQEERSAMRIGTAKLERESVREILELVTPALESLSNLLENYAREPDRTEASAWWPNISEPLGTLRYRWRVSLEYLVHSSDVRKAIQELLSQFQVSEQVSQGPTDPTFWSEAETLKLSLGKFTATARRFLQR